METQNCNTGNPGFDPISNYNTTFIHPGHSPSPIEKARVIIDALHIPNGVSPEVKEKLEKKLMDIIEQF